jgi:hypothetical protein
MESWPNPAIAAQKIGAATEPENARDGRCVRSAFSEKRHYRLTGRGF